MRKAMSILLCVLLLLGLFPSTVSAEQLPNGWSQMYSKGKGNNKETSVTKKANSRYSLNLFYSLDSDTYTQIPPESSEFYVAGDLLGEVYFHEKDGLTWDTRAAYPGMSGYIYTIVDDTAYAIAVQVGRAEFGVYTSDTINPNAVADNYVPQVNGTYTINYEQKGRTAYIIADDTEFIINKASCTNDTISVSVVNSKLVKVSVDKNFSGSAGGKVILNENEDYSFRFAFNGSGGNGDGNNNTPKPGLYENVVNDELICKIEMTGSAPKRYMVDYASKQPITVYYWEPDAVSFTAGNNSSKVTVSEVTEGTTLNGLYSITLNANCSGTVVVDFIAEFANKQPNSFPIFFTDGTTGEDPGNNDSGSQQDGMIIGGLLKEAHTVTSDDLYTGENLAPFNATIVYENEDDVIYMGATFYFGPNANGFGPSSGHGMALDVDAGEYDFIGLRPAFFTQPEPGGSQYQKVIEPALLNEIAALNLTYTIELDCTPGGDFDGTYFEKPQKFPDCYQCDFDVTGDICSGYAYKMAFENRGVYVATLKVTLNGNELEPSQSIFIWNPTKAKEFTAPDNGAKGTIEAINNYLADLGSLDPDISVMIDIPAGNFEGYLQMPANLRDVNVFFFGATDKDGKPLTTITGGLMGSGIPRGIHFKGAGAGSEGLPPETWPGSNGLPNQASLPDSDGGYGYVDFRECILEGYDYALYSNNGPVKGATDCTFMNNNAAILIDCSGQSAHFRYNTFQENGTAFAVYRMGPNAVLSTDCFTGSIFIDNGVDIYSKLEQNIFMPGVYFGYTDGNDTKPRECITNKPGVSNATKKRVFTYPQAATPERYYDDRDMMYYFESFIYDTSFYVSNNDKGPMISKNLAKTFPIPASVLTGNTFRIMDPEKPNRFAKITFYPADGNR